MAVGGPFGSSGWTARRLADAALDAAIPGAGPVLELGAGSGQVTQAVVDAGWPAEEIVVVERDADLCRTLERRFHGLAVLHGDALNVDRVLSGAGVSSVAVVVSGLPMRAISPQAAAHCYSSAFRLMPAGGTIIQYTYGFKPPVHPDDILKLAADFVGREWRNVPPMGIWRYRRTEALEPVSPRLAVAAD